MTADGERGEDSMRVGEEGHESGDQKNSTSKDADQTSVAAQRKYSLRAKSLQKRIQTEIRQKEPKVKQPRPKPRPPPLSKYRRRTANARERDRMKDINKAFDLLQRSIPDLASDRKTEKVTKITVLRLAINYIRTLSVLLDSQETCPDCGSQSSISSPSSSSSQSSSSSSYSGDLPDPLDNIENLTDFQLPAGFDVLLDIGRESDALDANCSDDFGDFPTS